MVTTLFCDLSGFTPLSEKLDPEEVKEIQDAYFSLMREQIERYGGTVEKYAGDAIMAMFGAPIVHEDDAERAVLCAMAMNGALVPLAQDTERRYGVRLAIHVGVNTGEVVSGLRQIGNHWDYDVTGDAVNMAARLESVASLGEIMVGELTMQLADRTVEFGERQMLSLKGKAQPVPGYLVLGPRRRTAERWELREQFSPFVGRDAELALLLEAWRGATAGTGRAVEIEAEPGVGKSRLLAQFATRIGQDGAVRMLRGRCFSYSAEMSLSLVGTLLRELFGLLEHAAPDENAAQVETAVRELLSDHDAVSQTIAVDVFSEALGVPGERSEISGASAQVRRHGLVQSLALVFERLSAQEPLLLVLEDVHWLDLSSREVLLAALDGLPSWRTLLVTTRRPEGKALIGSTPFAATLVVHPFDSDSAVTLATSVLGGRRLAPSLQGQIVERSGGNPFFIEELLRALHAADALEEREGEIVLRPGGGQLPATLQELLQARLDGLDPPVRTVSQVGSVIGRAFETHLLAGTMGRAEHSLEDPLQQLLWAGFIRPGPAGEQGYTFKHGLIQEVAYSTLLRKHRQLWHGAVARAILDLYSTDEHVDVLAHHFRQTDDHASAALWLERAGDRAVAVFANDAAIDHYEEARRRLELTGAPALDLARVDEKLGRVLRIVARYGEALQRLEAAATLYHGREPELEWHAVAEVGRVHRAAGTSAEGVARLRQVLDLPGEDRASSGRAALHTVLARLVFNLGNYQESLQAAQTGASLAEAVGDRPVLAEAEMIGATALLLLGRHQEALAGMLAAVPVAESAGEFELLWNLLGNIALCYMDAGQFAESLPYRQRALQVAERIGDPGGISFVLANLGELYFFLGDWTKADECLTRATGIVRGLGASFYSLVPLALLGQLHLARGEFAEARDCLDRALSMAREGRHHQGIFRVSDLLVELDLAQGDARGALARYAGLIEPGAIEQADSAVTCSLPRLAWARLESGDANGAEELAELAIQRTRAAHEIGDLLVALRVAGMAAGRRGNWAAAEGYFAQARDQLASMQYPYATGLVDYEWGRMLAAAGRKGDALPHLTAARETFARLGARPNLQRSDEALRALPAGEPVSSP